MLKSSSGYRLRPSSHAPTAYCLFTPGIQLTREAIGRVAEWAHLPRCRHQLNQSTHSGARGPGCGGAGALSSACDAGWRAPGRPGRAAAAGGARRRRWWPGEAGAGPRLWQPWYQAHCQRRSCGIYDEWPISWRSVPISIWHRHTMHIQKGSGAQTLVRM